MKNRLALRSSTLLVLSLTFFVLVAYAADVAQGLAQMTVNSAADRSAEIRVMLSAPATTISWDERDPDREKFDLPLLHLHRQRGATDPPERTLEIGLVGVAAGSEIVIEAASQHENVMTGSRHTESIVFTADRHCAKDNPCMVEMVFDPSTTISDLYYLRVKDEEGQTVWGDVGRPAFAALDTWDVNLDRYVVRIYFAALFPFARGERDLENRLAPEAVTSFVENEFAPIIRETWRTQVDAWGFGLPIHADWDADRVIEIIITDPPFALFDGIGTYTFFHGGDGRFTSTRRIWWLSSNNSFQAYESLEDAYKALFPHEFFHLMQWNVLLGAAEPYSYWQSWLEGQATVAPTIQYPEMAHSTYNSSANRFLETGLDSSYRAREADPGQWYDGALYWRFLYEAYGGVTIFRAALEEMARHASVDGDDDNAVVAMKKALDAAFARVDGPFLSFDDSLTAFARANYALRLSNGRCAAADLTLCGGLYDDPQDAYDAPPVETEIAYDGARLSYYGVIGSSYGMDFIEVNVDLDVHNQPLEIKVRGEGEAARFGVQLWALGPGIGKPRAMAPQPEIVPRDGDGKHVFVIPRVDWRATSRMALIISRLDTDETIDPVGNYQVALEPGNGDESVAATD